MSRIFFMARHGETDWNVARRWQGHTDIALNERGREQARLLAARLLRAATVVERIVTSDLARARQTGEIVARAFGVTEVIVEPELRERSFGVFEGLTVEECEVRYPEHWADYRSEARVPPPGAEAFEAVAARMERAMTRLAHDAPCGTTLVIGHGAAMRAFLQVVGGSPIPPLENAALFRFAHLNAGFEGLTRIDD